MNLDKLTKLTERIENAPLIKSEEALGILLEVIETLQFNGQNNDVLNLILVAKFIKEVKKELNLPYSEW